MYKRTIAMPKESKKHRIWESLCVRDFKSFMRPYVFITSIVGFFPCKIESSKYVFSKEYFVWATFIIVIYIRHVILFFYQVNTMKSDTTVTTWHEFTILIFGCTTIFIIYADCRSRVRGFIKVFSVSGMLSPQVYQKMSKWIYTKDILFLIPLLVFVPITITINKIFYYISWYTFYISLTTNNMFSCNLWVLKLCSEKINESLEELRVMLLTDQPHLLRRVYHAQRNPVLIKKLRALKSQQMKINEAFQALYDGFGLQFICFLLLIVLDITFNVYICISSILYGHSIRMWFMSFWFSVCYLLYLTFTVCICESVTNFTSDSATIIHRILVNTYDEEFITELELYSIQLYQLNNKFVVMGIEISAPLLTKVN
ncbi:uncharacterized protein LOC143183459 [Calliopsis andreniformis]|uniref:uncharacterized protein LOC143183459 n=1 Tax=Calliopsis andreniformis TaxID=337506 RepID=UPI003FCC2936